MSTKLAIWWRRRKVHALHGNLHTPRHRLAQCSLGWCGPEPRR